MAENEKNRALFTARRAAVVFALLFAAVAVVSLVMLRDLRRAAAEIERLKAEQVKLMEDYRASLEENHKLLTQSLAERYFDALILLRNRIEQGYTPTDEERQKALDRANFIVENMGVLDLPKEEAELRLRFIVVIKNLLEKGAEEKKPSVGGNPATP